MQASIIAVLGDTVNPGRSGSGNRTLRSGKTTVARHDCELRRPPSCRARPRTTSVAVATAFRDTAVMDQHRSFSADEASAIGERIGIDWDRSRFDVEQFRMGLEVELEHGRRDPTTNVTNDDELTTGRIAWAHLNEFPDYYTRLAEMEAEAERYWSERRGGSAT